MASLDTPRLPSHLTFPSPTTTTSYWRSEPHPLENHRSTPELPADSDVLIIGAGMSGVSIAYNILHPEQADEARGIHPTSNGVAKSGSAGAHNGPPSITILEARGLCSGATGRNGGHLKLAFGHLLAASPKDARGARKAIEIGTYHLAQLEAMNELSDREALNGDFLTTRSWDVIKDAGMWKDKVNKIAELRTAIEALSSPDLRIQGRKLLNQLHLLSTEHWGSDAIERITGVRDVHGGAIGVPAASLWPYKFVCSLTERILSHINLQTNTTVQNVSDSPDNEGYFTLQTSRGVIRARKVVFATNAYTAGILPHYESVIMPVKGTACHTVGKTPIAHGQTRTFTYNVYRSHGEVDYLNHRPDGGAVMGGAYEIFRHDTACCVATVDDGTLVHEEDVRVYFEQLMQTNYRDWAESGVEIDHLWTGIMGVTPDGYPHVGRLSAETAEDQDEGRNGRSGKFICAGFNGAGMLHILLAARGLARMIRDPEVRIEDTEIPSIFRVSQERVEQRFPEDRWRKTKV